MINGRIFRKNCGTGPWRRIGLSVAVLLIIAACSPFPAKRIIPPVSTYLLDWPGGLRPALPASGPPCRAVLVHLPRSGARIDTVRMAYMKEPYRQDYYAYHQWADSPARMLLPLMIRALDESGRFRAVLSAPSPIDAELGLDSELMDFQQIFSGDGSVVRISLRIYLIDRMQREVLASRVLSVTRTAPRNDPYGGVQAANQGVETLLNELVVFLDDRMNERMMECESGSTSSANRPSPSGP